MKRKWLLGALAVVFTVAATVVWFAPAAWLAAIVAEHSRVRLIYPSGTVWHGSALLGIGDGRAMRMLPGRVAWQLQWKELVAGKVRLTIDHDSIEGALDVSYHDRTVSLGPGRLLWPAAMLEVLGAPFNTISPGGQLRIRWSELHLSEKAFDGTIQVDWDEAQSALSPVVPLGDFRVVVSASAGQGTAELITLHGPLLLQGKGRMQQGHFVFSGTADAEPEMRGSLNGLIGVLGPRSGEKVLLNWEYRS